MTRRLSLSGTDWLFAGFHGEEWLWRQAYKREDGIKRWLPATVPGSVHWDLLRAGEIADPYFERNSLAVEWVHQRDWVYKRDFTVPADWEGSRVFLHFEGLDFAADVYLDDQLLGTHRSMFVPARFDVTRLVRAGARHHLAVALREAPREWPQIGRTSNPETSGKGRFGYWWDFGTRVVHLGIWQEVYLEATGPARLADVWVRPQPDGNVAVTCRLDLSAAPGVVAGAAQQSGRGAADAPFENASLAQPAEAAQAETAADRATEPAQALPPVAVSVQIIAPSGALIASAASLAEAGAMEVRAALQVPNPDLWWPNGQGAQPLYRCRVKMETENGASDEREVTFGIRSFTLEQNQWPAPGVEPSGEKPMPYTFTVNGRQLFVKGWNVVPVDHLYGRGDLAERYRQLVSLAQAAGVNLLRVWGGGLIETELFFDLCDRAGILVWQEFILSSSGTDNVPPSTLEYLGRLEREAEGIIPLRRNHPSLVLWCGGNELTDWEKRPATLAEPALALLNRKVAELDPDRPFIPSSPSGPMFGLPDQVERPAEQHDVHGPWHYRGPVDSYLPYNNSSALFHSEFGTQGAVAKASLDRFMAPARQWPPDDTNAIWFHHGAWWMQRHRVRELFGEVETIEEYLPLSQYLQAENLRYGVESNRRRWPVCSGTIIWQLNEPWPNGHNTSAVDYYLRPKMAYYYVKAAYAPLAASLRYEGPILADGALRAVPYVASDAPFAGALRIDVLDPSGATLHAEQRPIRLTVGAGTAHGVLELAPIQWQLPAGDSDVVICRLTLVNADGEVLQTNPYLFSRAPAPILGPLRSLPKVAVSLRRQGQQILLRNEGDVCAFFPALDLDDPRCHWALSDNFPLLLPGEERAVTLALTPRHERADTDFPHGRPAPEGPVLITLSGWNVQPATLAWEF